MWDAAVAVGKAPVGRWAVELCGHQELARSVARWKASRVRSIAGWGNDKRRRWHERFTAVAMAALMEHARRLWWRVGLVGRRRPSKLWWQCREAKAWLGELIELREHCHGRELCMWGKGKSDRQREWE